MKINKMEFLNALEAVKSGLAKKDIVEQATHFIFTGESILTYNDRICVVYPFETDFSCSVPSEELYKIISSTDDDTLDVSLVDKNISIKGKKIKASLATDTGDQILERANLLSYNKSLKKSQKLPKDFVEAITMCMFSTSKDATRPALTGVLIDGDYIASTDGFRISEYKMASGIDNDEIIVPATSIVELVKFEPLKFYIEKSWAYFINKQNAIFCCMIIIDKFPDYSKFLKGFEKVEITLPKNTKQMIEMVSVLAVGDFDLEKEITVKIESNQLSCKGQNARGWITNTGKIEYDGEPIEFIINPLFLMKILDHTASMFLGDGKILFTDQHFKHIISLVVK
jgi:DNA polymerase III sliding clamp (beta) subunit (PCNA family)